MNKTERDTPRHTIEFYFSHSVGVVVFFLSRLQAGSDEALVLLRDAFHFTEDGFAMYKDYCDEHKNAFPDLDQSSSVLCRSLFADGGPATLAQYLERATHEVRISGCNAFADVFCFEWCFHFYLPSDTLTVTYLSFRYEQCSLLAFPFFFFPDIYSFGVFLARSIGMFY